ncbi:putative lipoprotein [Segatella salivae F0493]|uniref:Putative lipoprotein n=1 Tax=Segatella salivae F0493 TaxID=1395125 RepID=U2MHA9_9BACT|nr:putative lipoprotein [Segatella salivae F0493]
MASLRQSCDLRKSRANAVVSLSASCCLSRCYPVPYEHHRHLRHFIAQNDANHGVK